MRTLILVRHGGDHFFRGALALGRRIVDALPHPTPDDLVIAWNRMPQYEALIAQCIRAGTPVVIAENGYCGQDDDGSKLIALALEHHCGGGRWFVGEEARWEKQNIKLKPWRNSGDHIVVMLQRGIGEPGVTMPPEWPQQLARQLKDVTARPVKIQPHPGKTAPGVARSIIERDIAGAHAVVGWSSGRPIHAILCGVPAFYGYPQWIAAGMAEHDLDKLETPYLGDREACLHRIGWAQWSTAEIASGAAIERVLREHQKRKAA